MGLSWCQPRSDTTDEENEDLIIGDGQERWTTIQTVVNYSWPQHTSPHFCAKCGAQWARLE